MAKLPISVLIDTYNHERFIEKAITSVLRQDFPVSDREIIVVDDGSTDRTPEIVQRFGSQVRYIPKANGGQASAFNVGIPECHGETIAFLDGDDYWLPTKLSRVVDVLAGNPALGLVGHGIKECFAGGAERVATPSKDEKFRIDSVITAKLFRLRKSFLGTSRMTLRADLARRILPVPEPLVIEADEYLFTLAAAMSDALILQEPLTCYVIHGGNLYAAAGADATTGVLSKNPGLRRKQRVMAALAAALNKALAERGLPADVVTCIVEIIQAESDQLRLMLDGGFPWETLRTERKIFEVLHRDATTSQHFFRTLSMIPASILPPRWFYAGRRWLGTRTWYRNMRTGALPIPAVTTVGGSEEFKV